MPVLIHAPSTATLAARDALLARALLARALLPGADAPATPADRVPPMALEQPDRPLGALAIRPGEALRFDQALPPRRDALPTGAVAEAGGPANAAAALSAPSRPVLAASLPAAAPGLLPESAAPSAPPQSQSASHPARLPETVMLVQNPPLTEPRLANPATRSLHAAVDGPPGPGARPALVPLDAGDNAMQGIEHSLPATRPIASGDPLPVRIAAPLARDLGLREGQVVQALVEGEAGQLRLQLGERSLPLPTGHGLAAGDRPLLRVINTPGGLLLQWAGGAATAPPAAAPAAAMDPPPASLLTLLARPPGGTALLRLFSTAWPELGGSGVSAAPAAGAPEIAGMAGAAGAAGAAGDGSAGIPAGLPLREILAGIAQARPAMATLNGSELRAALAASGLFAESGLIGGRSLADRDTKLALRRLLHGGSELPRIHELAEEAVHDIESAQLRAVQARTSGELLLNFTLPFADAPPVRLQLARHAPTPEEPHPPFLVNIHSQSEPLGEVWLNAAIRRDEGTAGSPAMQADLTMWATRSRVSDAARQGVPTLTRQLTAAGVQLRSFVAFDGPRPAESPRDSTPAGSIINLDA